MGQSKLTVSHPYVYMKFTCISDTVNKAKWNYIMTPMFGDFTVPVNISDEITQAAGTKTFELFNKTTYTGAKFIITAEEVKTGSKERTMGEVLLMIDADDNAVYSDEYSTIFKTTKVYDLNFEILNEKSVVAKVTSKVPHIKFSMKTIETIKASVV